ncbi:MAG: TIM barrel protein [Negativicutes bacterium]
MLELVNLSNYRTDLTLIDNDAAVLENFLHRHELDGIEMMLCETWDSNVHRRAWIQGAHLHFWPSWLDFWRGDVAEMLRQFHTKEQIIAVFGGLTREAWLERYRGNIRQSVAAGAKYLVLHVCHNRLEEIYDWRFHATEWEVAREACEWINELVADIPSETALLLENLWWPGLTLLNKELVAFLFDRIQHPNVGIMLDTGHLMNTNQELRDEQEGVDYILCVLDKLGAYCGRIRGIHLHCSLSGDYVRRMKSVERRSRDIMEDMHHVMRIDQHQPFTTATARRLLDYAGPDWLVHEFVQKSSDDWDSKVACQREALGLAGTRR